MLLLEKAVVPDTPNNKLSRKLVNAFLFLGADEISPVLYVTH
jgi:hypothetical protein